MLRIAVGPGGGEPRFTAWTEAVMKAWQNRKWSWDIDGLSLHNYTVIDWDKKHAATGFGEKEYAEILHATLKMDGLIAQHAAIMDSYDPQKKLALAVDEWGAWYAPAAGTNPGFLVQQNSLRDAVLAALNLNIFARHADRVRMANIAQMVNVLQAMILTDKREDAADAHLPRIPDVRAVPGCHVRAVEARCRHLDAGCDHAAARGCHRREGCRGRLLLAVTNVDPARAVEHQRGHRWRCVEVGGRRDAHRRARWTASTPSTRPLLSRRSRWQATLDAGRLQVELPPKSVNVITLSPLRTTMRERHGPYC